MKRRSIAFPLAIGIVLVVLAALLGIGWQLLVVGDLGPVTAGLTRTHWFLISLGLLFFALIIAGLLLLCIWLVREIRFNQRQQAFIDAVTHELKTPIASLKLYFETLGRHNPSPEQRAQFLTRMGADIARLERTVAHVLTAARAENTRRGNAPKETVPLNALLQKLVQETAERHALQNGALQLESGAGERLKVRGNAGDLGVVFRNLLDNAVKYSAGAPQVRVACALLPGARVAIEISDRGIGITRAELSKIFDRFYRAGREVQRQAGLGLGLFVVRALVRRNGGQVEAQSEGSGRGSRFRVILRTAAAPPAAGG